MDLPLVKCPACENILHIEHQMGDPDIAEYLCEYCAMRNLPRKYLSLDFRFNKKPIVAKDIEALVLVSFRTQRLIQVL